MIKIIKFSQIREALYDVDTESSCYFNTKTNEILWHWDYNEEYSTYTENDEFNDDIISMFETRPYIRGLYAKENYLILDGKIKQARDVCEEILKLNEHDNIGVRYLLMAIYAYLEEENDMLKLYKKYQEENLEMLFPLFILYYKQGNDMKTKEYLDRINKANPDFIKFFKGTLKENKNVPEGYYSIGDSSEVLMYFRNYGFLIDTMPTIDYYILENSKKKN